MSEFQPESLESILDGESETQQKPAVDTTPEPTPEDKGGDDKTADESKGPEDKAGDKGGDDKSPDETKTDDKEPGASSASEDKKEDQQTVPMAAYLAERGKRQDAERALAEGTKPKEEEAKVDPLEDPDGFSNKISKETDTKLNAQSHYFAEREFGKEKMTAAMESYQKIVTPELHAKVMQHPSPYHAMVEAVDEHNKAEEIGDLDTWKEQERERIRAEERQKVIDEMKEQKDEEDELRDSIPGSLAQKPSQGSLKGTDWDGPTSHEDIYDN